MSICHPWHLFGFFIQSFGIFLQERLGCTCMVFPVLATLVAKTTHMRKNYMTVTVAALLLLSCSQATNESESKSPAPDTSVQVVKEEKPASARPVHWSYTEEGGPGGWAALTPVYAACGNGKAQSPINIAANTPKGSPDWKLEYKTTSLQIAHHEQMDELINNGHTIQVTPEPGSSLNYAGKVYALKQFHFHTPSEHTIDGKNAPMEVHFVHQSEDKSLAVVGVLVKEGKHNANFDQLIKYLPNAVGEKKTHDSVKIDIAIHVPNEVWAYHYIGSLTTPPCSEDVQWLVLRKNIEMDKEQILAFSSRLKKNNRPTQPLNDRKMTLDDIAAK
jgi:carbonic anhydrase